MANRSAGCSSSWPGTRLVAPEPLQWPKGSTWLLQRTDLREVRARYLSPLALDDSVHSG
jgi:hypothetical protein